MPYAHLPTKEVAMENSVTITNLLLNDRRFVVIKGHTEKDDSGEHTEWCWEPDVAFGPYASQSEAEEKGKSLEEESGEPGNWVVVPFVTE